MRHHSGGDRNARDRYRDDPHFDATVDFCERYDQASFDPAYDPEPIEFFGPMVRRVRPVHRAGTTKEVTFHGHEHAERPAQGSSTFGCGPPSAWRASAPSWCPPPSSGR